VRSIIGIELTAIVLENEALGNPSKIWDGHLLLHIMSNICNICSPKGMLKNFVGGVCVDKPLPKPPLKKKTLTSNNLNKIKF
jgi:hypothetical protein